MECQKNCPVFDKKRGENNKQTPYNNSISSQCNRILDEFKSYGPQSTFQLRKKGIMHPGGRIKDLRNDGHDITTHFVREPDINNVLHRIALYVYHGRNGGHHV